MEAKGKGRISLRLSPEQQKQIKLAVGKKAEALDLRADELEERVTPSSLIIVVCRK